jgi:hypothetical protein
VRTNDLCLLDTIFTSNFPTGKAGQHIELSSKVMFMLLNIENFDEFEYHPTVAVSHHPQISPQD